MLADILSLILHGGGEDEEGGDDGGDGAAAGSHDATRDIYGIFCGIFFNSYAQKSVFFRLAPPH